MECASPASLSAALAAAAALAVERACYVWIARAPQSFGRFCARRAIGWIGGPTDVVRAQFGAFKVIQLATFAWWCYVHGDGSLIPEARPAALALGGSAMVAGQVVNLSVFYRLGSVGVFYGDRFGHGVPWCREFPFSLCAHPQYVGAVLTIWGLFAVMRYPHPDWPCLPILETAYYALGTWLETRAGSPRRRGRTPSGTEEVAPRLP